MTSDATPDTPVDPRATANEIAMRAAGSFHRVVEPELRVSKLFALNVATEVVKALADAGLLAASDEGSLRSQASGTPDRPLPEAYLNALRDAASGLNLKQVGRMRRISKSAAVMRLARARHRLRAITTAQAVYEATLRGLLEGVPRP